MKKLKKVLSYLLVGMVGINSANAALVVDITGVNGSEETLWTFSGSATAGNNGFFEDGDDLAFQDAWQNIGNYTTENDLEITQVSGLATLSIGATTRNIDLAYIDGDAVSGDDFGVGVDGTTNFTFSAGDLISWTGALTVAGIDLNDLNESGLPITFNSNNYGGAANTLDLNLNIGQPISNVPVPAAVWLFGSGLIGLIGMKKKSSKNFAPSV